jgi:hypothetical protein
MYVGQLSFCKMFLTKRHRTTRMIYQLARECTCHFPQQNNTKTSVIDQKGPPHFLVKNILPLEYKKTARQFKIDQTPCNSNGQMSFGKMFLAKRHRTTRMLYQLTREHTRHFSQHDNTKSSRIDQKGLHPHFLVKNILPSEYKEN